MGNVVHDTERVQIWASVDKGIASFVRYLNTIPGVYTHACCQGTIGEGGAEPYPAEVAVSWETPAARSILLSLGLKEEGQAHGTVYPNAGVLIGCKHEALITDKVERAALAIWREREIGFPPRVRRWMPDEHDRESGAWEACLREARAALIAAS
jgi:hypothetical protein